MKYLITGGAGFIGSNFIKYMLDKYPSDYFVCLDLLTYASSLESLEEVMDYANFQFIHGDICDGELVDNLFEKEKFDYVINFAAESHVDRSFIYEDLFYKTNVLGTKTLLDASIKHNVKRFHQISTDEVYGELPLNNKKLCFNENSPLNPTSPYSKSKAQADMLVLEYFTKYNLNCTISRSTNNYGIYQHPEKLIPKVVKMALNREDITLYGDGENIRDWIYVTDHCDAIDLILSKGIAGQIYNVGINNELSNAEVVRKILNVLNISDYNIIYANKRVYDDRRYALDCSKLKTLGWNSMVDFEQSFIDTVYWYKENLDWIERILNKA